MALPPPATAELTIGELADGSGAPVSALRFYERQGLLHSRRTAGNQRRYPRAALRRVAFIRASQTMDISLSVIGEVLAMVPEGAAPSREMWLRASECWTKEVNARIHDLERTRDRFARCVGCGCLSFEQCALVTPEGALGAERAGARRPRRE